MRTVLLANNRLGLDIGQYLEQRAERAGVVLHPAGRQKYGSELAKLDAPQWEWPAGLDDVRAIAPECILSVLFGFLIPPAWLEVPTFRALNLHPGLLPWNAGANPNVWPLVDGSPAGTTLHVMEPAFDTGAIMAQEAVPTYPDDTAETLYRRLETASLVMFRNTWPDIHRVEPRAQEGAGSYHRTRDLTDIDLTPDDLSVLDRLRARTFPPYGAHFERDGRQYRVRVDIERVD